MRSASPARLALPASAGNGQLGMPQGERILDFPVGKKPEGIFRIKHGHSGGLSDGLDPWIAGLAHAVLDAGQGYAPQDGKVVGPVVLADATVILTKSDVKYPM